jgi:hypothetical protein
VHDQLGVYQLAVQQGGFAAIAGEGARPAGAELVYLRLADGENGHPRTFQQASLDDVPFPIHPPDAAQTFPPNSRLGCIAGLPKLPRSFGARTTTPASDPAAVTAPSVPAVLLSRPGNRW